jgi:hypothetical protein
LEVWKIPLSTLHVDKSFLYGTTLASWLLPPAQTMVLTRLCILCIVLLVEAAFWEAACRREAGKVSQIPTSL